MEKTGIFNDVESIYTCVVYKLKGRKRTINCTFRFASLDEVPHFLRLLKSSKLVDWFRVEHWTINREQKWKIEDEFTKPTTILER